MKYLFLFSLLLALTTSCSEDGIEQEFFGELSGTVRANDTGEPLAGVKITTSPSSSTLFTDSEGNFKFTSIKEDTYSVSAEVENYDVAFEGAEVIRNQETTVIFDLTLAQVNVDAPTTPILLLPADNADDLDTTVIFEWEPSVSSAETLTYELLLRDALTNETQIFEVENDSILEVNGLNLGTTYFWQLNVSDGENPMVSSAIRKFSTLSFPSNPFLFVRKEGSNSVIFSGGGTIEDPDESDVDDTIFQLTDNATNSFRPRKNLIAQKIAFLRTVGGATHIFTMNLSGENVQQVTTSVPVAGFKQEELDFTWSPEGNYILYPSFDKLYRINPDGTGNTMIYQTPDGSLISEVDIQSLNQDVLLLKTNNLNGYDVRIYTYNLSTQSELTVILDNILGAAGGAQISANGDKVLYTRDLDNSQNSQYRIFRSRIFIYNTTNNTTQELSTSAVIGQNDLDPSFSPSEGSVIFTRVDNNFGAIPEVFLLNIQSNVGQNDNQLFTMSYMPDYK